MAEPMRHGAIESTATIAQVVEAVRKTRRPLRLRFDDVSITVMPDVQKRTARPRTSKAEKYPTVASLAGAAGTLATPHPWPEVLESARDEHLAAKFGSPRP